MKNIRITGDVGVDCVLGLGALRTREEGQPQNREIRRETMKEENATQKAGATPMACSIGEVMDMIDSEIVFLREVLNLLEAARLHPQVWGNVSFLQMSGYILEKMQMVKTLLELVKSLAGRASE
jgi:hypothetical protein